MKNHIAEELPARKHAPAAAGAAPTDKGDKKDDSGKSPEQRAKQAVYDIRYRARREDIPLRQAFSQYMQNSSMGGQEKTIVKAKLFGKEGGGMKAEDFNPIFKDAASDNVAKALFKVFVEGTEKEQESISLTYVEELDSAEHRKYKVRVTDKNTKRSYVRMATREKINQLRANPNIESVEMTQYGEPYEGERKKGSQTARVAAGKGLDPVGQEDGDVDNDGDKDKSDKYLMKRRGAIGNAIATRKEEFIHEAGRKEKSKKSEKLDIKNGINNKVTIAPTQGGNERVGLMAHNELEGELISETGYSKFLDMIQEKKLTKAEKAKKEEIVTSLKPKYGKTSKTYAIATSVAKKVAEEMDCGSDDKKKKGEEEDPRSMKTKDNLVRNKLRAMGLKMSYEPEGETIDELNRFEKETGKDYKTGKPVTKGGTMGGNDSNSKVMRHMNKVMGAGRMGAGGPIQQRGQKKVPGKKPPEAGKYGSERRSPEQIVKNRRATKQQGKDNMSSRFD
jgi:hypothetical protein